ncbi:MAG TPA: DUF5103 domain-containing protein [Flavobacterium sp.]|nr:DUF5103 domain-containing protein [Flavobacterium sp.]
MKKILYISIVLFITLKSFAFPDPYYIKSAAFHQGNESLVPIFKMDESFRFSFDDLIGDEADYYYKIVHCTPDWKVSDLKVTEYLNGMQYMRIDSYQTSFNTFQPFVHYTISFPNRSTQILISGNYLLEIYSQDNEKVLERRFVLYEDLASVSMELKRPRNLEASSQKQNVYLTIDFGSELLQNPRKNVRVVILQNGQWYNALNGLQPQYILGNKFQYQYDEETNFWAGNEFLFFDNSDIRRINNTVSKITRNELYEVFLYPRSPLKNSNAYSFFQDVNGAFKPRNRFRDNDNTEADYAWVYFTYNLEKLPDNQKLYIVGMFNDYQLSSDYEMKFEAESASYKTALFLKQGFVNYKYVIASANGKVLEELNPDGNFVETENVYHTLVYYKGDADRYERIIGLGKADSKLITN